MTKPSIGRIVHYWRQGYEVRLPSAAIVLEVHGDDDVSLVTFECPPLKPGQCVPCGPDDPPRLTYVRTTRSDTPLIGHWTWPERV